MNEADEYAVLQAAAIIFAAGRSYTIEWSVTKAKDMLEAIRKPEPTTGEEAK